MQGRLLEFVECGHVLWCAVFYQQSIFNIQLLVAPTNPQGALIATF